MNSIARRGINAAIWNYSGNLTRVVLQFGIGVLLARLIGPEQFGLVAITLAIISLGQIFVDFGFNAAVIQTRDLKQADVDSIGTVQIAVGAAMTALMFALAGPIAAFYKEPTAVPIVQAMSLIFVLRSIGQTSIALLSRDMKFRSVQIGNVSGYVIGYVLVGVPMAFADYGPWSIVFAQLSQTVFASLFAIVQTGRVHRLTFTGLRRDMLVFGRRVLGANLGSWTLVNVDSVIVGHLLGSTNLALYNRAFSLPNTPSQALLTGLQGVLFSATSRAQGNLASVRRAFYGCVELFTLVLAPILLTLAVTSSTVILALYGPDWIAAAELLPPLSIAALIGGLRGFFGPIIMGLGRVEKEARAQWSAAVVMVPAVYLAAQTSALTVAWTVTVIYLLRFALLYRALAQIADITAIDALKAAAPGVLAGVAAASAALSVEHFAASVPLYPRLGLIILAAGIGVSAAVIVSAPLWRTGALGGLIVKSNLLPRKIAIKVGFTVPDAPTSTSERGGI